MYYEIRPDLVFRTHNLKNIYEEYLIHIKKIPSRRVSHSYKNLPTTTLSSNDSFPHRSTRTVQPDHGLHRRIGCVRVEGRNRAKSAHVSRWPAERDPGGREGERPPPAAGQVRAWRRILLQGRSVGGRGHEAEGGGEMAGAVLFTSGTAANADEYGDEYDYDVRYHYNNHDHDDKDDSYVM